MLLPDRVAFRALDRLALSSLSLLLGAAVPPASSGRARLEVTSRPGAEGCVEPMSLEDGIAALLGRDPFDPSSAEPPDRVVELELRREGTSVVARLALRDASGKLLGERILSGPAGQCRELTNDLALAAGNALDPIGLTRSVLVPRLPAPEASAEPAPAIAEPESPAPPPKVGAGPQLFAGAGVVGSLGAAPTGAIGFALEAELRWPAWGLVLDGRSDQMSSRPFEGGAVATGLEVGELAPCRRFGGWGICALLQLGAEAAQGSQLPGALLRTGFFAAAGARGLVDLPVAGPLSLRGSLDLLSPLTRENVLVGDSLAFTTPPLAGAVTVSGLLQLF